MSVGLDIGSQTIKIVEVSPEGDKFRLHSSGIIGYKGSPPEETTDEKSLGLLSETIKKLHREARIKSKEVIMSLPEAQVFTRVVKFPLLTESEISSAVKWEAEQYIPIPINDAVIRHQIIGRREDKTPPQTLVLLVAVPKNLVEAYVNVVHNAGLTPVFMETDLMAMTRSLAPENQTVVLVDFGAKSTNIAIANNKVLTFSRSIPTAGEAFTRAISQYLGIEPRQAEEYKRAYGLSAGMLEGRIKRAIEPVFRMVADEIRRAIHYYQADEAGVSPNSVILAGGTAGMPEIINVLTRQLGLEVIIGNPFQNVSVDKEIAQSLSNYSPLYSIAVGLAMRDV